jgi:hypothetical protein
MLVQIFAARTNQRPTVRNVDGGAKARKVSKISSELQSSNYEEDSIA